MDPISAEVTRWIQEALSAPPGVKEVTTQSGRVMRLEREPEPGIELRVVVAGTAEKPGDWLALCVEPVAERPSLYPADLPFVPGVRAIVTIIGETTGVTWQPSGAAACPVPDIEPDSELVDLTKRLKAVRADVRAGNKAERARAGERVKAIVDSLAPATRAKLEELWHLLQPDAAVLAELEQVFEAALQASIDDGWRVVERNDFEQPVRSLSAHLQHEERSRRIVMMGLGRNVTLVQGGSEPTPPPALDEPS